MTANPRSDWELFSAIRKEELSDAIASNRVQVVNVLEAPEAGPLRLIAHSRHIPLSELQARLGELDRGRDVVVYCKNRECPASLKAARLLAEEGFHVRAYEGGVEEWVAAGLPTDADAKKLPRTETATVDLAPSSRAPDLGAKPRAEPEPDQAGARADAPEDETAQDSPAPDADADADEDEADESADENEDDPDESADEDDADDSEVEEQRGARAAEDEAHAQQTAPPTERTQGAEGRGDAPEARAAAAPARTGSDAGPADTPFREPASSFLDCLSTSPPSSRSA